MLRFMPWNSMHTLVAVGVVVVSALTLLKGRRRMVRGVRLPPGPSEPHLEATGDIFMIRVLKQDIIIINSKKIAKDLFDRRSRIYSDRPYIATRDLFGWSFNFGWSQYGDQWRSQRRMFHQAFRAEATLGFHPIQLRKTSQLILDILGAPRDYSMHIQRFSAAVIMSIVYGYEVAPNHDHLVELFERGNALAMEGLTPERASIIDCFPFSLPEWFPGSFFRRKAVVSRDCATRMIVEPFDYATSSKHEATGSGALTVALDLLKKIKDVDDPSQLQLLKDTCATAFVAGAETVSLNCFMLAMLQHLEVQERAQAEIDVVVGIDRLPNFDDRPNLPFVEAILMETLRMYAVAPLAIPHGTTEDDIYEDVFIPKGRCIITKMITQNLTSLNPERFLVNGRLNGDKSTDSLAFGFGRRVCPGRYTADGSVWIAIVSILYAFKITKAIDEQGKEVDFEPTFSTGVTTCPNPFPCSITLRSSNINIHKLSTEDI
ncbi:cytochrome P450 [Butyriboletus roseoflavus]|nr:cytochrome P450 [Butyriboletus roseoflavus]